MPIGTPEETLFNRLNMDFDRQSLRSVGRQPIFERPGSDIKKTGIMKKMKTMKKKFFVLRSTSSSGPARLEYYDSEKKYKSGQPAKHPIHLHTCFNINKKSDSRHGKYGIVLFTTGECFTFLTDTEEEQNCWLSLMLEYQDEYLPEGYIHKEHYDHVWQVTVQPKGLGLCKGSKGPFRLCLNSSLVSLVKPNGSLPHYTIQLVTIRSVAHNDCSFRMEVGKYAPTGEGEFWFSVDDSSVAKDMHETLLRYMNSVKDTAAGLTNQSSFRSRTGSQHSPGRQRNSLRSEQQRPSSCYQTSSGWSSHESPSSPNYPQETMRARTNTGESRKSYTCNHHEDSSTMPLDIDQHNTHISVVPEDMSPPSSPACLDEQVRSYMEMDMKKNDRPPSSVPSTSPGSSSYLKMGTSPFGQSYVHKEVSSAIPDPYCAMGPGAPVSSQADSYLMMVHHQPSSQMSAPIPIHSFSESHHPSPLPTVREGGSNEGYLPMDISNSPASSSGILRPEPAKCMLSDDTTELPPRTYSLGSRPVAKKEHSYIEMGPRNSAGGNDMSRATSAPHIINKARRQEREHNTDSPTTSASPLSMSLKSDDSDSFMEYMSMRPRTASDSYNYRPRTSSFGKLQPMCRPRSASHGQGTRPFPKFSKLAVEQSRISQDPMHRTSMESSLQGSFDSLRVSNESLRKTSQEIRKKSGSNASDYAEMRGTPSPQLKLVSSEPDGYVNMQPGTAGRKSSPHRIRSDSSGSGRRPDIRTNSSDRLQQQTHLQQIDDYTEMAPTNVSSGGSRDSYMNMDYGTRQSNISDVKLTGATIPPSLSNDSEYMTMELDSKKSRSDTGRSVSMENVDTYVMYDPSHSAGNKQRTGSLGSKDKQIFRPTSSRKPSSVSMSSCSPSASSVIVQQQPSVSTSTRTGGSSDSIRKASRQSSMEKYSLGKDFRKKSGSTGSRPSSAKLPFSMGKDHNAPGFGIMPVRKPASTSAPVDDLDDEYIEFSPTATKGDSSHPNSHHPTQLHSSVQPSSHPSRGVPFSSSGGFSSAHPLPSPAEEEAYTLYNPAPQFASKTVHFQPQKPPPSKLNIPSSAKQGAAKEAQDYVGFEPGPPIHSVVSPSTSHRKINEAQEYVEYQPATAPGYFTFSPSLQPHESSRADGQEYVGYEPGPVSSQGASKPVSPNSVMSYIKGSSSDLTTGKSKQSQGPKQQQTFSDLSNKTGRGDAAPGKLSPSNSTHKTELPFKEGQIFTFPGNSQWSSPSASSLLSPNAAQPPPVYVTNAQNLQHPGTEKVAQHSNFVNKTNPAPFSSFSTAPPFPVSSKTLTSDPFKDGPHPDTAQQSKQPKAPPLIAGPQTGQQCLPATQSGQQCLPATQSGQQFLPPTQSGQPCLSTTQSSQNCLPSPQSSQKCLPATQSSQRFLPATPSSQPCLSVIHSGQECLSAAQTCTQSQSCSQNTVLNEGNHYVSYNPAQSGSFKSPKEDLAPETPLPSACLLQGAQTFGGAKPSVFTELTIDTGVENSFQGNVNQPQKNSHGYQRQTSAPASTHPSQALDTPKSNPTAQQPQVTSDSTVAEVNKQKNLSGAQTSSNHQPMSPIPSSENSKRHKHLSGSSTSDAPSPSASTNRHKHPSGSSTSSQKSRKASTDSEKSISKGSKSDSRGNNQSDSNSSLNLSGGKTKRRMPSGDKSPGSSAEKSPMSPTRGGGEFFCGEASPVAGKDLEAKMAVVKAKIQQSFGDVSGMVSSTSKDGHGQSLGDMTAACKKDGHGLIRPGSTPCMQSLDAAPDVSRSAGDTPNFSSRSCCLQFSSSSRTRHSIPDLGNYQQINFASSSGLVSTGSEQKVNTSSSNSGSGESCGSTHSEPAFKPLIYVKLDLGGSEGQGDADLKVPRIKSRNSSDADEKQPPLSYAQIDFVKSQNLNKGKSMTMAGGDSSSKS